MSELVWYFGYGSNMSVKFLEERKKVKVIESAPAVLKDFRMAFSFEAFHRVEPGFAGLWDSPGSEVHGVAFCTDKESADILDAAEGANDFGYQKEEVPLKTYTGRALRGSIYIDRSPDRKEFLPSKRYLDILISGAKEAGLESEYIAKLESHPYYVPNEQTLKTRLLRPKPEDLPVITLDELSKNDLWTSVLGYVCKTEGKFPPHRGREISTSLLLIINKKASYQHIDQGKPSYPLIKDMSPEDLEFITQWLDTYSLDENDEMKPFVGYLKEFHEQQLSGTTSFVITES